MPSFNFKIPSQGSSCTWQTWTMVIFLLYTEGALTELYTSFPIPKLSKDCFKESTFGLLLSRVFFVFIHLINKVKVAQPCPTLSDPMDYTVQGTLQARILEWVAFLFSRGSSQPRDRTQVSRIAGGFFTSWATREVHFNLYNIVNYILKFHSSTFLWAYSIALL